MMKKILFSLLALLPLSAFGQCPGYSYYEVLTIPAAQVSATSAAPVNFNAWFSFTDSHLAQSSSGGYSQNANGWDIVFADNTGKNRLPFELFSYNGANGAMSGYVQIPSFAVPNATTIEMCVGNRNVRRSQASTSLWNAAKSVYHFASGALTDDSPTGNTLTAVNAPTAGPGFLAGIYSFTHTSSQYLKGVNPMTGSGPVTYAEWINVPAGKYGGIMDTRVGITNVTNWTQNVLLYSRNSDGSIQWDVRDVGYVGAYGNGNYNNNSWHLVVGVYDGLANDAVYVDGNAIGNSSAGNGFAGYTASALTLGCFVDNSACADGSIAEVEIWPIKLTTDYIITKFNAEKPGSTFFTSGVWTPAPFCPTAICVSGNIKTTGSVAFSQAAATTLSIVPSATPALATQSVTLTSNRPVHPSQWQITSGLTGATITPLDLYHAKLTLGHVTPNTNIGGCMAQYNDNVLNTPITTLPILAQSATWISSVSAWGFGIEPSFTPNFITGTLPAFDLYKNYYGGQDYIPHLTFPSKKREGGWDASTNNNSDHHYWIVTTGQNQCHMYEAYNDVVAAGDTESCHDGTSGCNASSSDDFLSASYSKVAGTDAAGLPQYLTLRLSEIKNNSINHPSRVTFNAPRIQSSGQSLWPANGGSNGWGASGVFEYGARLRLHAAYGCTSGSGSTCVYNSKYSQYAQYVLNSWKNYGIIVADIGDDGAITTDMDVWEDPAVVGSLYNAIGGMHWTDYDVVDESCLMLSPNSLQVNPANTCNSGAPIVSPNSAWISATDVTGTTATISVPVQPVMVGLLNTQVAMVVASSSYSYNFGSSSNAWVVGSPNQSITWSIASGPGSVTSAGVYTPPTTISGTTTTVLTATPAADPAAATSLYVMLIPAGSDGSIRLTQAGVNLTDGYGFTWYPAPMNTGIFVRQGQDTSGSVNWANLTAPLINPERNIYQNTGYVYPADVNVRLIIPNGNYRVRFLFGAPFNTCTSNCNIVESSNPGNGLQPVVIGVNGQLDSQGYQWGVSSGMANGQDGVAWDYLAPGQVTNNIIDIWDGDYNPLYKTHLTEYVQFSAIEITPDNSTPHIAIDTGYESWGPGTYQTTTQPLPVTAGSTAQLNSVGWYMPNSVTWSISGPGSITQNGLYTAPATAPATAQTVVVTATSTVDTTKTATATLTIP